jgi:hypothetical protein
MPQRSSSASDQTSELLIAPMDYRGIMLSSQATLLVAWLTRVVRKMPFKAAQLEARDK